MHPAEHAEQELSGEVHQLVADGRTKPGTQAWFRLQALGCALSMLRGMIGAGAHEVPEAAERYRRKIKVKGLQELDGGQP